MERRAPVRLPDLLEEWGLAVDGPAPPREDAATVLPVVDADGVPGVLKLTSPGEASEHEALALQRWSGDGAVRLLRADPARGALLVERAGPGSLADAWDVAACEVVGDLYRRLHRPAPPRLRPLSALVAERTAALQALPASAPLPRRLVEQAVSLGRRLGADEDVAPRLLHTDLHYGHVLAAEREPWLVVSPSPLAGDPHYEVAPLLVHRWDELAGDVRAGVRRRFHAVVDAAGLDEDRARDWVVVRVLHEALGVLAAGGGRSPGDRDVLTARVAVAKAVQE